MNNHPPPPFTLGQRECLAAAAVVTWLGAPFLVWLLDKRLKSIKRIFDEQQVDPQELEEWEKLVSTLDTSFALLSTVLLLSGLLFVLALKLCSDEIKLQTPSNANSMYSIHPKIKFNTWKKGHCQLKSKFCKGKLLLKLQLLIQIGFMVSLSISNISCKAL